MVLVTLFLSAIVLVGLTSSQPAAERNGSFEKQEGGTRHRQHSTQRRQAHHCLPTEPCWPTAGEISAFREALDPSLLRPLRWDSCIPDGTMPRDECGTEELRREHPVPCAIPAYAPWDQPLYALGSYPRYNLDPLYVRNQSVGRPRCYPRLYEDRDDCLAGTRNIPVYEDWDPAFIVFAMSAAHVQTAVRFAVRHNLCVMVAGTGHDFINRHSCDNGVFIRTALLKSKEWNLNDPRWADGSVRLGAGNTFHEVQKDAAERGRYISQGWAISVGVVGWSIGGGHGPFAPSKGMGIDNILEVEIVTANGMLVVANEQRNSDLWWAVRGGGGSTWGVITSITLRTHLTPEGGFTIGRGSWSGGMCGFGFDGRGKLHNLIDGLERWKLDRNAKWSGLSFVTLTPTPGLFCGATWNLYLQYVFSGPYEGEGKEGFDEVSAIDPSGDYGSVEEYEDVWDMTFDQDIEYIFPFRGWEETEQQQQQQQMEKQLNQRLRRSNRSFELEQNGTIKWLLKKNGNLSSTEVSLLPPPPLDQVRVQRRSHAFNVGVDDVGGIPSVLVSRETAASGALLDVLKATADLCASGDEASCSQHQIYHAITGNIGSPQDPNVSTSAEFRKAIFHLVTAPQSTERMEEIYYKLGASSYFSESAYFMEPGTFANRYWGDNYHRLREVKSIYDPTKVFWCRHCVGDDD